MAKLLEMLSGKKTYLICVVAAVAAAYTAYTGEPLPEWAWAILGALGLGSMRAAVQKSGPPPTT